MSYKTILTIIQNETEAEALIGNAVALSKKFGAYLIGFHSEPVQAAYTSAVGFPDAEFIRATTEMGIERTRRIAGTFESRAREAGVEAEWGNPEDDGPTDMSLARSVDLIVAAQPGESSDEGGDIDSILNEAGRPVLILPLDKPCAFEFRHVVVGWNGSRQAARAVFDALPLLAKAASVEIVVVDNRSEDSNLGDTLTATLKRQGVKAQLVREPKGDLSIEEVLANRVAATNADLLVLGAYGHSWLREFLFGGVTRQLLTNGQVATFMSH